MSGLDSTNAKSDPLDGAEQLASAVDELTQSNLAHDCTTRDMAVAVILSVGTIASLMLFIVESFAHPTAAVTLVPLIFGPVGVLIVHYLKQAKVQIGTTKPKVPELGNDSAPHQGASK